METSSQVRIFVFATFRELPVVCSNCLKNLKTVLVEDKCLHSIITSSAYAKYLIGLGSPGEPIPSISSFISMYLRIGSKYTTYKRGDSGQPCLIPLLTVICFDKKPLIRSRVVMLKYMLSSTCRMLP